MSGRAARQPVCKNRRRPARRDRSRSISVTRNDRAGTRPRLAGDTPGSGGTPRRRGRCCWPQARCCNAFGQLRAHASALLLSDNRAHEVGASSGTRASTRAGLAVADSVSRANRQLRATGASQWAAGTWFSGERKFRALGVSRTVTAEYRRCSEAGLSRPQAGECIAARAAARRPCVETTAWRRYSGSGRAARWRILLAGNGCVMARAAGRARRRRRSL
jgi:hypothetical protein